MNQPDAVALLLGLITDNMEITNQSGEEFVVTGKMASKLLGMQMPIQKNIQTASYTRSIVDAARDYFEDVVIPEIIPNLLQDLIHELCALISADPGIPDSKKVHFLALAHNNEIPEYLSNVFLYALQRPNKIRAKSKVEVATVDGLKHIFETLRKSILQLPAPKQLHPPELPTKDEQPYISELHAAYGDKEGIIGFCESHLAQYYEYNEDRNGRRIDYFAAESVRVGLREMHVDLKDQFDVLKDEMLAGVENTARRTYPDGYERMLSVMEQAVQTRVAQYVLNPSPNWISNRIKMGACHFLVNDGKLRWVR